MKTRHQKPEESLQEYAFEMQRLTTLAFSDFSANVREMICLENFVDGLKDEEIMMGVRMADFKDQVLKSALLYALKVETAIQANCIDCHSIQEARVTVDEPCESRCIKGIEKLKEEMQALKEERQNRRRRSITCWGCGESRHLRSNCLRNNKKDRSTKCWGCSGAGHLRNNCTRVNQKDPHRANGIESKKVCSHQKGSADGNIETPSKRPCTENKRVAFDVLGPLPRSSDGNNNIPVVMDYFTKWPEAYPIPDQEASTDAEALVQHWISRFGVLIQLHSHQGINFDSAVCKRLCEILAIDKTGTTASHPQSDDMVERFNRTILSSLSLLVSSNQQDWDKKLPFFLLAYRSAVHETTGYSPSQMLFVRDLRLPADLLFSRPPDAPLAPEEYIEKLQARMEKMHHLARERIGMASEKMKTRYDAREQPDTTSV
ncbi:retrovirus-related Pol polyprotein from transposon 412 [Trichonephila clavipes]|nr:retrovirus-related Pol polyprotein from transposon 412 [Trichonephila clavipes]